MAGFRMHISTSALCGAAYGSVAVKLLGHPPETAILAAGLTAIGGMLPDLDSDSGTPIREMFGLAAAVVPLLLIKRLEAMGLSHEGILSAIVVIYLVIRYGLSALFKRLTIHRGMFHSIPCMLIFGLLTYLAYDSPLHSTRILLGLGVMIGFLSHLVLDEIYSVDFNGLRIKFKSSAGSAVKFFSPSFFATTLCYGILGALLFLTYAEFKGGHVQGAGDLRAYLSARP